MKKIAAFVCLVGAILVGLMIGLWVQSARVPPVENAWDVIRWVRQVAALMFQLLQWRFEVMVSEPRLLFVVALGIGMVQGFGKRQAMVAFVGYSRNTWLSAWIALALGLSVIGVSLTLPYPVPYEWLVVALCGCAGWAGYSGVVGLPISRARS